MPKVQAAFRCGQSERLSLMADEHPADKVADFLLLLCALSMMTARFPTFPEDAKKMLDTELGRDTVNFFEGVPPQLIRVIFAETRTRFIEKISLASKFSPAFVVPEPSSKRTLRRLFLNWLQAG
jgi:hypothetical protein